MYRKHHLCKKTLAVILSVVMLAGMFSLGLIVPSAVAKAAESSSAALPMGNLTFIVPEAIYLYPNGSSWTANTASPFQYYINNDANNAPLAAAETTGKIYYKYAYTFDQQNYGAENAAITYQFVNSSFQAISGGSVTLSSNTIASGSSVDITAGMSPNLAASANGCYILWTLTFTDKADGKVKHAYALTYVYKPYVAPVGAMVRTKNQWGGAAFFSYAQQITWLSGVHSITPQTGATHDGNYYPNYSGDKGMSAFITAGDTAYVGGDAYTTALGLTQGEAWTASHAGATRYKLAFLNTPTSTAHFNDTTGFDNAAATGWGDTNNTASTFNVSSFDYFTHDNGLTDHNCLAAVFATPYGNLYIDTSRYSDLGQIPNLAVGLMATDNEDGDNGNWYVADYSEGSRQLAYNGTKTDNSSDSRSAYFNDFVYIIAGQGTNSWDNFGDQYEQEGVKYAGAWPRALLNVPAANDAADSSKYVSTYNYAVKGMYANEDPGNSSDYSFTHAMIMLSAKQYNKSTLRAAVQRAISEMASLGVTGISNGNITSCYFDANSNYKWTALQAAFKNALVGLTTLNSDTNPNELAKALNTALDELCTRVTVDPNGGSFQSLNAIEYVKIGDQIPTTNGFRYTPTYSGPNKEYYNFKGWSGNPDTHSGLSYVRVGYNGIAYATWEPVPFTMTLVNADDDNVNTEIKTATYNIESTGTMAELFAAEGNDLSGYPAPRQGYSFWYWEVVEADEGSNWTVGEQFYTADRIEGRHGNVKLKAYWAEGMVDVNVYNYEMNTKGSYLNDKNRLVPADSYLTYGRTNNIVTIDPQARVGFTVNQQKSRLTGTVAGNGSTILKVFYDRNQYNVAFVNYDGTELQTKACYHGAAPVYTGSTPRRPAAEGISYTFAGWTDGTQIYTEKDEKGNVILPAIEGPATFTAYYSETETLYNVTANAGEGTAIDVDEGTYTYKTKISVSAEALAGYVADGLKLYANGVEIANPTPEFEVTEDVVFTTDALETVPSYIVSFYDAEGSKLAAVSVAEGGDAAAAEGYVPAPEREGYTFAQWSLPVNNVTGSMTVIAQYNKDGATNYSFNFYSDSTLLATLVREAEEEFEFPAEILGTPEKEGFDFIGWDPADFSPAAADTNVYAVFQPNGYVASYTLTVKYENGAADGSFTEEVGTSIQLSYPERAGYVFTGWTGDTAGMNGERYTFQTSDATITATWYDLAELNVAEAAIDAILADSESYHSTYTLRLKALKNEKTDKTAVIPASAADLDDLLARMKAAIADAPNWLLYTLTVTVDGQTVDTVKDIAGAAYTLPAANKTGYVFNGWSVSAGTVSEGVYTFAASNDEAVAQFTFDISVLQAEVDALSDDVYCRIYIAELNGMLDALRTAIENGEDIDEKVEEITALLSKKDENKHKYTEFVGYDEENGPTCTEPGKAVYACVNCSDKTVLKDADALGHDWGEWVTVKEPDYGVDGEAKRTCSRCGEEETKVLSLLDQSDKAIRFVTMNNMYYTLEVGDGVTIRTLTTYRWFSTQEMKFKVHIQSGFAFPDYVIYINGEEVQPDGSGYYTVPAAEGLATVSIAGVVRETPSDSGSSKTSFWQWLVNFFRSIAEFFQRIFNR